MKISDKRGQFYLLVSIILIALVISFAAISNYSKTKKSSRVYDLKAELSIEGGKILDYGAISGTYEWDGFTQNFSNYAGNDIEIVYIVGILGSEEVYKYNDLGEKETIDHALNSEIVSLTFEGNDYSFKLKPGQNFYFIISQHLDQEYYVTTN